MFEVLPALELQGGQTVRVRQGDYAQGTSYRVEPLVLAHDYAAAGANWLHLIDLDGARNGTLANLRVIEAIAHGLLAVQVGGGVRSAADLRRLLDAGASRVTVGSVAVQDPDTACGWIADFGAERICIALEVREEHGAWRPANAGRARRTLHTLETLASRFAAAGAKHVLCTDVDREGALLGPNLALYTYLRALAPDLAVQASSDVRDAGDVRALREAGLAGVVLGRSLLEGRLTLADALAR